MRHLAVLGAVLALTIGGAARADETITIRQFLTPAPNAYGSPSWNAWVANAQASLQAATPFQNVGSGPAAFTPLTGGTFVPGDAMVTSYSSWLGTANPAPPYDQEYGTRLHASAIITDVGGSFTLRDVSFNFGSSDSDANYTNGVDCFTPNGSLCYQGDLSGTDFSNGRRVGLQADGVTLCDATHPCTDTTPLSALYYVGVGNAFWPGASDPDPTNPLLGQQGALDDTANYINDNVKAISNTYCVKGSCDTATVLNADFVPEPASLTLLAAGLAGLGAIRRRTRGRG